MFLNLRRGGAYLGTVLALVFAHSRAQLATLTASATSTAIATPAAPLRATVVTFSTGCTVHDWTVPSGVTNLSLTLWGSGGVGGSFANAYYGVSFGGGGAYLAGVAYVTPGESLRVTVGGFTGMGASCGSPGTVGGGRDDYSGCGRLGGGYSSVARLNVMTGSWDIIALAAGGGAGARGGGSVGLPGSAVDPAGCGQFNPRAKTRAQGAEGTSVSANAARTRAAAAGRAAPRCRAAATQAAARPPARRSWPPASCPFRGWAASRATCTRRAT